MNTIQRLTTAAALAVPFIGAGCAGRPNDEPLENLRGHVPGIHLFDEDKNNILSEIEVQRYVDAVIVNGNKNITSKETADKILEVRQKIRDGSPYRQSANPLNPYYYRSKNVEVTLESFHKVRLSYLNAHYDEQDAQVKTKLEKLKALRESLNKGL